MCAPLSACASLASAFAPLPAGAGAWAPAWRAPVAADDCFVRCLRARYYPSLVRAPRLVLAAWLVIFALSAAFGPSFLSSTRSDLSLPAGTPSEAAGRALAALYPDFSGWPPAFVVQHTSSAGGVVGAAAAPASRAAAAALQAWCAAPARAALVVSCAGWWELAAMGPAAAVLAAGTLSHNNATMRSTVNFAADATLVQINTLAADLLTFAAGSAPSGLTVGATGLFPLFSEMSASTEANFLTIDAVVLPVAIIVLGTRVRSYRHMLVALIALAAAMLLAFAVLVPVSKVFAIDPFAPSIMLSLGIAITFDYCLFTLTRFREERIEGGKTLEDAVFAVLASSGHVVVLSGLTLVATFVLLLFFPQNFLQSVGYACTAIVLTSVLVQVTVVPSLLLSFRCFSQFDLLPSRTSCCCRVPLEDPALPARRRAEAEAAAAAAAAAATEEVAADVKAPGGGVHVAAATDPAAGKRAAALPSSHMLRGSLQHATVALPPRTGWWARSFWFNVSWHLTATIPAWLTLLAVIGITIPFALAFFNMRPSSDSQLIYLQGSASLTTMMQMQADFPIGSLDPYTLLLATGVPGGALTPAYFAAENALIQRLIVSQSPAGFVDAQSVSGLSYFGGANVSFSMYLAMANASSPQAASPVGVAYRTTVLPGISADASAALVTVQTLTDPDGSAMVPFIVAVRALLNSCATPALPNLAGYLVGGYSSTLDVQDSLYRLVPAEIGAIVALVLLIIGTSFGSAAIAVRLVITVIISLCWTYGLMVLVYQPGAAQDAFAVISPTLRSSVGLYWIIPIMSFSILVGLALDYDIFILTRMREFRLAGWSDRAAICLAVEKTGSIVSTAGLIMIISFVGLLIPKTIVLNQYGFSLLVGVAIDTFLMRPIVVPVIITLLGSGTAVNWWPTKMAPPHLSPAEEERALRCGLWEPRPTPPPPSSPRRSSSQRLPTGASWRQPAAVSLHSQSLTAMALPPPGIRGNSSPRLLASNSMRLPQGQVGMSSRSPQRLASSRTGMPGAAAAAQLATLSHTRRSPTPLQADNRAHSSYPRLSP